MTKTVKILIAVIGILSIISGAYLAYKGSEFFEYFSGIFLGIVLVGSVFLSKETQQQD